MSALPIFEVRPLQRTSDYDAITLIAMRRDFLRGAKADELDGYQREVALFEYFGGNPPKARMPAIQVDFALAEMQ